MSIDSSNDSSNSRSDNSSDIKNAPSLKKAMLIPLAVFLLLVLVLGAGFQLKDPHLLPSVLIDRPFPEFSLAALHEPDRVLSKQDILGEVSLVNVWATWCPNCVIEHPELLRIAREEGTPIFGINYNDDPVKARAWLKRYENPFTLVMVDNKGKLGIDLGVYGAPETFVVDAMGVIQFKHVGVVDRELWDNTLAPLIKKLKERAAGQAPGADMGST